jgi:GNAT superfamily N-acetyltransferase
VRDRASWRAEATWRIACLFVDKRQRRRGVARTALVGALQQIAAAGGGETEDV